MLAVDNNALRLKCARHNAQIYGVADRVDFVLGDVTEIVPRLHGAGLIFMSPPWGGPEYIELPEYHLTHVPIPHFQSFVKQCLQLTENLVLYLPRNLVIKDIQHLSDISGGCEIEMLRVNGRDKCIAVYCGDLIASE